MKDCSFASMLNLSTCPVLQAPIDLFHVKTRPCSFFKTLNLSAFSAIKNISRYEWLFCKSDYRRETNEVRCYWTFCNINCLQVFSLCWKNSPGHIKFLSKCIYCCKLVECKYNSYQTELHEKLSLMDLRWFALRRIDRAEENSVFVIVFRNWSPIF